MLLFRPHHFLCTLGFQGKGYSVPFIKNYQKIVDVLKSTKGNTSIRVISQTDDICRPCPHRRHKKCHQEDKIKTLDGRHLKALTLKYEQVITWADAQYKIKKNISVPVFHTICDGCQWKSWGICEAALLNL